MGGDIKAGHTKKLSVGIHIAQEKAWINMIAEKYARAIGSSHLEWKVEPSAIDTLTAAGMLQDSLGVGLLRLRAEFDTIRTMPGSRTMMPRLKSAAGVRTRMLALVFDRGGMIGDAAIEFVAKLLDAWCDPSCQPCTGRGTIGEYGAPQMICQVCGGSKRRTLFWPQDQQGLADRIAAEMESKVDAAERKIRRLLRD